MTDKTEELFTSETCPSMAGKECSVEKTLNVLGGKWSYLIIKHLFSGKKRFGELRRLLHDVNSRSLTNSLRNLEEHGVIGRKVFATVPATVEYSLTAKGKDLEEIITAMYFWGERWID